MKIRNNTNETLIVLVLLMVPKIQMIVMKRITL